MQLATCARRKRRWDIFWILNETESQFEANKTEEAAKWRPLRLIKIR